MAKKEIDPAKKLFLIKISVYIITALFLVGSISYGVYKLSSVFSTGFSTDVFVYPLMMARRLFLNTLFTIVVGTGLVIWGLRNAKFWYLLPIGTFMIAFYWLKINLSVYHAYYEKFLK